MKRQFSFKGCSRVASPHDIENLPPKESQYGSNKFSRNAWTDMRVEEIKKKYDTPSHQRKNGSSFGFHEYPKEYRLSLQRNDSQNFNSTKSKPLKELKNMSRGKEQNGFDNYISRREETLQKYNIEENERTVFDKIEQMKNCLLNEKKDKENYEVSEFKNYKDQQIQVNPRVANIDKINDKIKKILDCLHENDKYIKNQRAEIKASFIENISDKFEHTQVLSKQKIQEQNQYSKLDTYCLKKSEYPKKEEPSETQLQNFYRQTSSPNPVFDKESSWFKNSSVEKIRSRSCLHSFDKEEEKLKGGKKIDDEISKITTRIKQFEEEKKKLNIDFKPFHLEIRGSKSAAKLLPQKSQRNDKPPLPIKSRLFEYSGKHNRSNTDFKNRVLTEFDAGRDNEGSEQYPTMLTQKSKSTHSMHESKTISMKSSLIGLSECKNEEKDDETMKEIEELKKKAGEGIENRKKLLETTTITFATQTKRLIESLFEQVKLDENFRNSKIWFRDAMIENRWLKLKQLVSKKGIPKAEDDLKKEYNVCEDEDNPFYSVRDSENTIEEVLESEKKAEKHWEKQIVHRFNRRQFQEEKFTCEKIDLEKKGYFVLEDLVRFINMETGTFYRNRDLYLVFRRLTKTDKMSFQRFIDILVDGV